jgi:hypothetical protein
VSILGERACFLPGRHKTSLKEKRVETLINMRKFKLKRNSVRSAQVNLFSSLNLRRGMHRHRPSHWSWWWKGLKSEPLNLIDNSFIERKIMVNKGGEATTTFRYSLGAIWKIRSESRLKEECHKGE